MTSAREPLAIVGIGCRFPGPCNSAAEFWRFLQAAGDALSEVPADRYNLAAYYHSNPQVPGRTYARRGGFVSDFDRFDARFFGIAPREAHCLDPQQRWLLETAFETLQDAGYTLEGIAGSRAGVFIGASTFDYMIMQCAEPEGAELHTGTGGALSIIANRISYAFDLRGPSLVVDTACSSALAAVKLACDSVWRGECSWALAGGVNAILSPAVGLSFAKAQMLSQKGRCAVFDAEADGYVRSEGAGLVLIKPLSQALAAGERVYAVIRAALLNQDGHSSSLTVPRAAAQEALLRAAYAEAGIAASAISYIEAHGTGTAVGDPIEAQAIGSFLAAERGVGQELPIGSVKANIGHLEAAAGIAGLIKAVLVLWHRQIPPQLHFRRWHPAIAAANLPLRVPVLPEPLPESLSLGTAPLVAGVNSFGFGGANAHVVLQAVPAPEVPAVAASMAAEWQILPVAARSAGALAAYCKSWGDFVKAETELSAAEICEAAAWQRSHLAHRFAALGRSGAELTAALSGAATEILEDEPPAGEPRVGLVFSGQGPQWWGMARELMREPIFRRQIEECDEHFAPRAGWSLKAELETEECASRLRETEFAQPCLFAWQIALAELWRSWGITPEAVVGHSLGEVSAAHLAGALSLPQALELVYQRSRWQQRTQGRGAMAAVGLSATALAAELEACGGRIEIAAYNGPELLTVAGEIAAVEALLERLAARRLYGKRLPVNYAFHSFYMDEIQADFMASLPLWEKSRPERPFYSTVSGELWQEGCLDAEYWWRNLRAPVLFEQALGQMAAAGVNVFIEISPQPVLAGAMQRLLAAAAPAALVLAAQSRREESRREESRLTLLKALAQLYRRGQRVRWEALYQRPQRTWDLPRYPWQRERFWREGEESRKGRLEGPDHPLLGRRLSGPQHRWQQRLSLQHLPFLRDHRLRQQALFPGAAYIEMVLAVGRQVYGQGSFAVEKLELLSPLFLREEGLTTLVVDFDSRSQICEVSASMGSNWTRHARALIRRRLGARPAGQPWSDDEVAQTKAPADFYRFCAELGLDFGPSFRLLDELHGGAERVSARIRPSIVKLDSCGLHPTVLDAALQCVGGLNDWQQAAEPRPLYVPGSIGQLRCFAVAEGPFVCNLECKRRSAKELVVDLRLFNEQGELLLLLEDLSYRRLEGESAGRLVEDCYYQSRWEEGVALPEAPPTAGTWLLLSDGVVGAELAQELKGQGARVIELRPGWAWRQTGVDAFELRPDQPADWRELLAKLALQPLSLGHIIQLWGLAAPLEFAAEQFGAQLDLGCLALTLLWQAAEAAAPDLRRDMTESRLTIVTRGAQWSETDAALTLAAAPLWGFGRVLLNERSAGSTLLVDLERGAADQRAEVQFLLAEILSDSAETEVARRGVKRLVNRVQRIFPSRLPPRRYAAGAEPRPFKLECRSLGQLSSLNLRAVERQAPAADELELRVRKVGLNFRDVLKALRLYSGAAPDVLCFGDECSAVVAAVGSAVRDFKVGDSVVALHPGAARSYLTLPQRYVRLMAAGLSEAEAAAVPVAFITAYYALVRVARLQPGERVLIHAAAGGVGQAARQVAKLCGAEIWATAGSAEKRALLKSQGVAAVFDSRSLDFADQIRASGGAGMDVVLNSLAGDFLDKSLALLAPGGRFVELGKRDIYEGRRVDLGLFKENRSFHAIDLAALFWETTDSGADTAGPPLYQEILQWVEQHLSQGDLAPLPYEIFPVSQAAAAFERMAQGRHHGKLVLDFTEENPAVSAAVDHQLLCRSDRSYVVVGGNGGFGWELVRHLATRGARQILVISRSGRPPADGAAQLGELAAQGVRVLFAAADVADRAALAAALPLAGTVLGAELAPLGGVIHAAMILDDALVLQLNRERLERVMAPKVLGAWHLHELTKNEPLEFFIMCSSVAALFGSIGQANYAAANAFLDALAQQRVAEGRPALSINFGLLGESGYLARNRPLAELLKTAVALEAFSNAEALTVVDNLVARAVAQAAAFKIDWPAAGRRELFRRQRLRLSSLVAEVAAPQESGLRGGLLRAKLLALDDRAACAILQQYLCWEVAGALGDQVEKILPDLPLVELGLDSLMAFQLKLRIDEELGLELQPTEFIAMPSVNDLVAVLLGKLRKGSGEISAAKPLKPAG